MGSQSHPEVETLQPRIGHSTAILATGFVLSAVTGYLRDAFIAGFLGANSQADAFVIAYTWLDVLVGNVGPALAAAVIPSLTARHDPVRRRRLAASILVLTGVISLVGAILIGILSPSITTVLAPGLSASSHQLAAVAMLRMSPAICTLSLSGASIAVLSARMRFLGPVVSVGLYNLLIVGGTLVVPRYGVQGLAAAVTAASGVQLVLLGALLRKQKLLALPDGESMRGGLSVIRAFGPIFLGTLISYSSFFVDRGLASKIGSGAVVEFNYALRLGVMSSQVAGTALASAVFPVIGEAIGRRDRESAKNVLKTALRLSLLANLAVLAIVLPWRSELIQILYQHGKFGSAAAGAASQALGFLILGCAADGVSQALWRLLFSLGRVAVFLLINVMQLVVHVVTLAIFVPRLGLNGIALAVSGGLLVQFSVLIYAGTRELPGLLPRISNWQPALRYFAVVSALVVTSVAGSLLAMGKPESLRLPTFVASTAVAFVIAALIGIWLRLPEGQALAIRLRRWRGLV